MKARRKTGRPVIQDELYRIGRDVLRNAFHHARAMRIEVEVLYGARAFRLRIRDNGIGIGQKVLEQGARLGNWGLPGVRERARLAGAKLNFWSEAGAGAEVQVTVTAAITYGKSSSSRIPLLPIFCGLKLADSNPRCR
jgi:signal transduction histidine kinase